MYRDSMTGGCFNAPREKIRGHSDNWKASQNIKTRRKSNLLVPCVLREEHQLARDATLSGSR